MGVFSCDCSLLRVKYGSLAYARGFVVELGDREYLLTRAKNVNKRIDILFLV